MESKACYFVAQICMLSKQRALADLRGEQKTDVQVAEAATFHKSDPSFACAYFSM